MDNMSLKEIQTKLLLWESGDNALAPITADQREAVLDLESLILGVSRDLDDEKDNVESNAEDDTILMSSVDTTYDFLEWYESLCESNLKADDASHEAYHKQLEDRRNECVALTAQIDATLSDLGKLSEQYNFVSDKTNALHMMSEQLLADQNKLSGIGDDIKQKLHYFTQVEHLSQRLNSPTMSVNSEAFFTVLAKIDECLDYMRAHPAYKEAHPFTVQYRHLQSRATALIRSHVTHALDAACDRVSHATTDKEYALYFGQFQAVAPKITYVVEEVEKRAATNADYATLLYELEREYAARRARVAGGATLSALRASSDTGGREHCAMVRACCSLLAHACRDECSLYEHIFNKPPPADMQSPLQEYLQSLCNMLYETLRPQIIHINHLETLAELCVILRVELIEEQLQNEPVALAALGVSCRALLQDAQERLVFRAHVHLRADVLHYRAARADLAYPHKLHLMQEIALSIQQAQSLKRSDSRNSMVSDISATSQEVANITVEAQRRPTASPADLHGMWYPAVRRTLAALSRLYRCLEKKVFQGLAQEAISFCVQNVDSACKEISANATPLDGELFEIKHLLILREQIAPFQVDFIIKETSLDFSNMRNAAFGLIQKPRQIFSLNSNNALLEFLLEGTPVVREHLLDSRKEVDRQLKSCCESFITDATQVLAGPMIAFMEKAQSFSPIEQLKSQPWATAEEMAQVVKEAQRRIRTQLAPVQRSMQLYLSNKETEFILFRPIRNNVVGYFIQIEQLLTNAGYSYEDRLIVACPTPEQVSVFISSASLISHNEPVQPYGVKASAGRKTSVAQSQDERKTSVAHLQNERKTSVAHIQDERKSSVAQVQDERKISVAHLQDERKSSITQVQNESEGDLKVTSVTLSKDDIMKSDVAGIK